jgi:hypothetical protein
MAVRGNKIRNLLNIHADEGRMASLVIGVMLLKSAGFTLGSTGIGTLFLTRYGVKYLPYMYLPLGIISLITSLGITTLLGRVRREVLYRMRRKTPAFRHGDTRRWRCGTSVRRGLPSTAPHCGACVTLTLSYMLNLRRTPVQG